MDVLAHTLWTNALFYAKYARQRRMRYWAAFFGVTPDLIGFPPLIVYLLYRGLFFGQWLGAGPDFLIQGNWAARFAVEAYNYTHSLVLFAGAVLLVMIIGNVYVYVKKKQLYRFWFFWPLLGWGFHILLDIPTHPDFYQTPLLFPLSDFRVTGGIFWGHPVFMAVNYSLIILVYVALYLYNKRRRGQAPEPVEISAKIPDRAQL